jgi:thioredoxin reductase (NADPH)
MAVSTSVLLVGAGPIGLEMAVVLKTAGIDYVQVEAEAIAHTVTWYPRQTRYFSSPSRIAIAGVPLATVGQEKATREEYLAYLRGVVKQFELEIRAYEKVEAIEEGELDGFVVRTTKQTYHARRVILAIGDMHLPRMLDIPGEEGPHVSHYFTEPHPYFGQKLLIVGGKNSAVEAALRCHHAGAHVSISYRRDAFDAKAIKYWLTPEINALIEHGQIAFYPETEPVRIEAGRVILKRSEFAVEQDGSEQTVDADFVLLLTGYAQDKTLFESAGITLEGKNRAPVLDWDTMQTSVDGLYVVGTAAAGTQDHFKLYIENSHPHVLKVIASITGEAPSDAVRHVVNTAAKTFGLAES